MEPVVASVAVACRAWSVVLLAAAVPALAQVPGAAVVPACQVWLVVLVRAQARVRGPRVLEAVLWHDRRAVSSAARAASPESAGREVLACTAAVVAHSRMRQAVAVRRGWRALRGPTAARVRTRPRMGSVLITW